MKKFLKKYWWVLVIAAVIAIGWYLYSNRPDAAADAGAEG